MQTLIICKGCSESKPHQAQGYCRNCYHKFIVRGTGNFDKNDTETYQKHLSVIKQKISVTQKQRRSEKNAIISQLTSAKLGELYSTQKMSMGDIAKLFNCSRVYIMLLLKKYNLPIRSKSVARGEAKKKGKNVGFSSINEKFFKEQTPEMAYVLGFIYSDGNIDNQHNHFSIAQKEPEILYKIKDLMSSEHQIIRKNNQDIYVLTVGNKIMVDDLLSLGLTPNKSLDAKFPALRKDLYCHFIRGYFDGDGSICLSNKTWRINFTSGSRDFLIGLEEVMASCTGCTRKPVYISFKTKERKLVYSKKSDLTMIYNYFYDEITRMKGIFLDRKHELFKQSVDQNGIKDY